MTAFSMIVELKKKYKNTLIGKVGKKIYFIILNFSYFFKFIFYRIFPSSYYSNKKYKHNNSEVLRKSWEETLSNDEYELKSTFLWGGGWDNTELTLKYNELLKKILSFSHPHAIVLEVGSYDGMWTQYFLGAEKIICVDLFESGFEKVKERCKTEKIQFYCTEGNELHGIMDRSVDLIFSVDSLVRASKGEILSYFNEFNRILKVGGEAVLHLPCLESRLSSKLFFTYLTLRDIKKLCRAVFSKYDIHFNILPHGVIVEGKK